MLRNLLCSILLLGSLSACSIPPGEQSQPEGAHYLWLNARAAGDSAALWPLLHPDVQASFEAWHQAEREALADIEAKYPVSDRPEALTALGEGARAKLPDAKALFVSFVQEAPAAPSGLGGFAARSRSVSVEGTKANITSWGGDTLTLQQGSDGLWYVTLSPEEAQSLQFLVERAQRNLRTVKANVAKLSR